MPSLDLKKADPNVARRTNLFTWQSSHLWPPTPFFAAPINSFVILSRYCTGAKDSVVGFLIKPPHYEQLIRGTLDVIEERAVKATECWPCNWCSMLEHRRGASTTTRALPCGSPIWERQQENEIFFFLILWTHSMGHAMKLTGDLGQSQERTSLLNDAIRWWQSLARKFYKGIETLIKEGSHI